MPTPANASNTYKGQIATIVGTGINALHEGAVGDNSTDNKTILQDISTAIETAGGGTMHLPMDANGGVYLISDGFTLEEKVRLTMDPGVTIMQSRSTANTAAYAVSVKPGAQVFGGRIAVDNNTYTGSLLRFDGGEASPTFNREDGTIISNLMLEGAAHATKTTVGACRGIHLYAGADGEAVQWVQFNNINLSHFNHGIRMETAGGTGGGGATFVNGNQFNNIQMDNTEYGIVGVSPDANNRVDANIFNNIHFQTAADTQKVISWQGNKSKFNNVAIFDWATATGTNVVDFITGKAVGNSVSLMGTEFSGDNITGDTNLNSWDVPGVTVGGSRLYTVATLASAIPPDEWTGHCAFATNGRKAGEGVGVGTGVLCFSDGTNWIAVDTGATVAA